jgi:hypothetical protein
MRNLLVMGAHPVAVLLVGLVLTLLVSGCGGASPETRARQTRTALHATATPTPLRAARTAIVQGPATGNDQDSAVILTAEARLPIVTAGPPNTAIIVIGTVAPTREGP